MNNEDDLKALYDDANRIEVGQPAARVRAAALAHAKAVQSAQGSTIHSGVPRVERVGGPQTVSSNANQWKFALAASIVLVPVLGLLVSHLNDTKVDDAAIQVASNSKPEETLSTPKTGYVAQKQESTQPSSGQAASMGAARTMAPAPKRVDRLEGLELGNRPNAALMADTASKAGPPSAAEAAPAPASPVVMPAAEPSRSKTTPNNRMADAASELGAPLIEQLGQAARGGDVDAVLALVKRGVPLNGLDAKGRSALIHAVTARQSATVEALLRLGADAHAKGADGVSAMELATRSADEKIINLFKQ